MAQKNNWIDYKTIIDNEKIDSLYHFTDRENLESIIQKILFSYSLLLNC